MCSAGVSSPPRAGSTLVVFNDDYLDTNSNLHGLPSSTDGGVAFGGGGFGSISDPLTITVN